MTDVDSQLPMTPTRRVVTAVAAQAAAVTVAQAAILISAVALCTDGRSFRKARKRRMAVGLSSFRAADVDSRCNDGWFRAELRCTKTTFNKICELVELEWRRHHGRTGHNACFAIRDRVAVTIFYLTHSGSVRQAAGTFGMGKTSALRFIWEVIEIIVGPLRKQYIVEPGSHDEWIRVARGFEELCGFPNVCFAVDGSLLAVERPYDFEGWYCRKGFPAINAQVVVDSQLRILSYDLRPGSANDRAIWRYSRFGREVDRIIPAGCYGVGDAGYTLSTRLLTPYATEEKMNQDEVLFNYLHSKTRIVVERTFGSIKNRFRILKIPLCQKETSASSQQRQIAKVIQACFILHNIMLVLSDEMNQLFDESDVVEESLEIAHKDNSGSVAILVRDRVKSYLWTHQHA